MSYGWLTESAILPSKKKQIDLDSKTFIDMKVNLAKEKEKLGLAKNVKLNEARINTASKGGIKFKYKLDKFDKFDKFDNLEDKNNFCENKKELDNIEEPNYENIRQQLEIKQNLYNKLKNSNSPLFNDEDDYLNKFKDNILIGFENKNQSYQKNINKIRHEIISHDDYVPNFDSDHLDLYLDSERNTFGCTKEEPEFNNEFEEIKIDSEGNIIKEKVLVKQSFDKILTRDEKQALVAVKDEEKTYKQNLDMLKKKREKEREDRLERLKKMKIN